MEWYFVVALVVMVLLPLAAGLVQQFRGRYE